MVSSSDYHASLKRQRCSILGPDTATLQQFLLQPDSGLAAAVTVDGVRSYENLRGDIGRRAALLLEAGIGRGDIVGVQLPNTWDFMVTHAALAAIGAVTATLHLPYRERERKTLLDFIGACAWIGQDGRDGSAMLRNWPANQDLAGRTSPRTAMSELGNPEDPFAIFFTSGTHSLVPKPCLHSYDTLLGNAVAVARDAGMSSSDVFISASPFTHLFGMLSLHLSWVLGATQVLVEKFAPARFVEQCSANHATVAFMVPTHVRDLVDYLDTCPKEAKRDLQLREIRVAGAAVPSELVRAIRKSSGAAVINHWGMSELGEGCHTHWQDDPEVPCGSIGNPVGSAEIRIMGSDENLITEPGVIGELLFRGCSLFHGYFRNPDATVQSLWVQEDQTWLRSGDLASWRLDGRVQYRGRLKDIVNRGGMKISAMEIEEVVATMPGILCAVLVAVPDDRLGERGCLAVVVDKDTTVSLEQVCQHLEQTGLARFKWPERLVVCDEIPRTPTGKVAKARLRELVTPSVSQEV